MKNKEGEVEEMLEEAGEVGGEREDAADPYKLSRVMSAGRFLGDV